MFGWADDQSDIASGASFSASILILMRMMATFVTGFKRSLTPSG